MDLNKIASQFTSYHRSLPAKVGAWAVEFYKESFRRQGYIDKTYVRWRDRKYNDHRQGRNILTNTGALKRSIRVVYKGKDYVIIGSNLPYARAHNEGFKGRIRQSVKEHQRRTLRGKITVRSHSRNMEMDIPARPYIYPSDFLERRIIARITYDLEKMFGIR